MSRIPFVTENTVDVASDVNGSLIVADGLIIGRVTHIKKEPVGPHVDGQRIGIEAGATGAFAGKDGQIAIYVEDGNFWRFYNPVLCVFNDLLYISKGGDWVQL